MLRLLRIAALLAQARAGDMRRETGERIALTAAAVLAGLATAGFGLALGVVALAQAVGTLAALAILFGVSLVVLLALIVALQLAARRRAARAAARRAQERQALELALGLIGPLAGPGVAVSAGLLGLLAALVLFGGSGHDRAD